MSKFWVTHPDTVAKLDKDLEAEGARLLAEVAAIEALSDVTACRLCGARTALTDEHAPSKKAGNKGKMIRATVDGEASATKGAVIWKSDLVEGAIFPTLCAPCNNNSGSWYNPAYLAFVEQCRPIARPQSAGGLSQFGVARRPPVAKQALTSIVATSQPGLTTRIRNSRRSC